MGPAESIGGALEESEIEDRIGIIAVEVEVERREPGQSVAFKLGEWRAFRGQEGQLRYDAFAISAFCSKFSPFPSRQANTVA